MRLVPDISGTVGAPGVTINFTLLLNCISNLCRYKWINLIWYKGRNSVDLRYFEECHLMYIKQ